MTQVAPLIDLGVMGDPEEVGGGARLPLRWHRTLVAAVLGLACLLALGASAPGRPALGEPLWTGDVSLNGFTLGSRSIYLAAPGGSVVLGLDATTGRQRWSIDITDLPDRTVDLGGGVAAVATRVLTADTARSFSGRPEETIRFVRDSTGEQLGQTSGYLEGPSAPGLPVIVFSDRPRTSDGCADLQTPCVDVTAWQVSTTSVTVAWRSSLAPGTSVQPAPSDTGATGLLELDENGGVRLLDLASGQVEGTTTFSSLDRILGQALLVRDALVIARREPNQIVLTAYRRPTLAVLWSVRVPSPDLIEHLALGGFTALDDCGWAVCLDIDGNATQLVDLATGSVSPPAPVEAWLTLGDGAFVAASPAGSLTTGSSAFVLDRANRITAEFADTDVISWDDRGGRALLRRQGPNRTGFILIDPRGRGQAIGSVTGRDLRCGARGDILACSDGRGTLRVWRLPL